MPPLDEQTHQPPPPEEALTSERFDRRVSYFALTQWDGTSWLPRPSSWSFDLGPGAPMASVVQNRSGTPRSLTRRGLTLRQGLKIGCVLLVMALTSCSALPDDSAGGSSTSRSAGAGSVAPRPTDLAGEDLSLAQWTQDVASCMREGGFSVKVLTPAEGGWGIAPPDTNSAAYSTALSACMKQVGDLPTPQVDEAYAGEVWQRQSEIFACLKSNGFTLSATAPPAKAGFVAQMVATGTAPWTAYEELAQSGSALSKASAVCPQQR